MTRTEEILHAIAQALEWSDRDVVRLVLFVGGLIAVLIIAAWLQRSIQRRRLNSALASRFEREVWRLDLSVRQLDVLNKMARHLNDNSKKYLLLTNRNTFAHCARAVGKLAPPLDESFRSLEIKLGFADDEAVESRLGRFLPAIGVAVKLETPDLPRRLLAHVVSTSDQMMRVNLDVDEVVTRGSELRIWASHPSGIVVADGRVERVDGSTLAIRLTHPFAAPGPEQLTDRALMVFVRAEGQKTEPQASAVRALWSTGATMDNPERKFRKRDDIQIVFRRNHAKWVVVNGEVTKVRKRRRIMKVRFSHLSREAREEVLGIPE